MGLELRLALLAFSMVVVSCSRGDGESRPLPSASASASASAFAGALSSAPAAQRLMLAEHRRDSAALGPADLAARDPSVRRLAVRALARIADAEAVRRLRERLRDEDAEVVMWSAYGLGYACRGREAEVVPALVLRAASWLVQSESARGAPKPDPLVAIAHALGRCATPEAERTLRAWLERASLAAEAALALGNLAARQKRLEDATLVLLLDAASRKQPLESALYPFSQLGALGGTVESRLLDVARHALEAKGLRRTFAIRALGNAGAGAVEPLTGVLTASEASPSDRTAASRALRQLGSAGQEALGRALAEWPASALEPKALLTAAYAPLLTTLEGLEPPAASAKPALTRFAELPIASGAEPGVVRRLVKLRCTAATLLAGQASAASRLLQCDPDPEGVVGQLARIAALDRGPLTGARQRAWARFAESSVPRVRQAALQLLGTHVEVEMAHQLLTNALGAKEPGTVATAAQILAAYPERAARGGAAAHGPAPAPELIKAFGSALEAPEHNESIERLSALIDAAGALQLLSAKAVLERHCQSDQPTLREHAERALVRLGDKGRTCDSFTPPKDAPAGLEAALRVPARIPLLVETDVGKLELELDSEFAPVAVARVLELVDAGYYADMPIHRVVPGFVVQFGDRGGDGFGDGGRPTIRCETSPRPFQSYEVGMALAGRDTAASQPFVTLDRFPRLDGDYAWLGRASAEWSRLVEGDRILRISRAR